MVLFNRWTACYKMSKQSSSSKIWYLSTILAQRYSNITCNLWFSHSNEYCFRLSHLQQSTWKWLQLFITCCSYSWAFLCCNTITLHHITTIKSKPKPDIFSLFTMGEPFKMVPHLRFAPITTWHKLSVEATKATYFYKLLEI